MFHKRRTIGAALCLLFLAALAACDKAADAPAIERGGTVVIGVLTEPNTLNPLVATAAATHDIINLMFLKLLDEQADFLHFEPRLAESWYYGPDSLSITFRLRRDAVWQDGHPVTSADVRYTWQLHRDPEVAWPHRHAKDRVREVEVIDDYTVTYHFTERYPYQLMDANDGVIVPKHVVETIDRAQIRSAAFGRNPVGNGPYRLSRWESGQFIELQRNDNYYDPDRPLLDRVIFRIVPDMTTLLTLLKTGEIDCLESLPIEAVSSLQADFPDIAVYRYLSRAMNFIVWNVENELFEDREVRRALAMAINGRELIEVVWSGMAETVASPMHPILWAHDPSLDPIAFDPDGARAILVDRGWRDTDGDGIIDNGGRKFEFEMQTNQGATLRADVVTLVQTYLRGVGIKVNARVLEGGAFFSNVTKGTFESCVLGWKTTTKADLSTYWSSDAVPPNGFNAARYRNSRVDDLIRRARATLNDEDARRLWAECQRQIYSDQPFFFLSVPYETVGLNERICGAHPNAISSFVNLHEWYVSDDCD